MPVEAAGRMPALRIVDGYRRCELSELDGYELERAGVDA